MLRYRKIIFALLVSIFLYLGFSLFLLPLIVRNQLEEKIASTVDRNCSVAKVSINPVLLSAEVVGFKVREKKSEAVFCSFSSMKLRVSPSSLWRLAPVVSELQVTSPYVHIQRDDANSYNFTDIIARQKNSKKEGKTEFSLNNIVVVNGRVEFDDNGAVTPKKHKAERIALKIPFISNISYFADEYVDPELVAVVNGAPLRFNGKLKPFDNGLQASLDVNLHDVNMPYYAAYLPEKLPVKVLEGQLSAGIKINHHLVQKGKPDINLSGALSLNNVVISEHSGKPLLSLKELSGEIAGITLLKRSFELRSIKVINPRLTVTRDSKGTWNLLRLNTGPAAQPVIERTGEPQQDLVPEVLLKEVLLTGGMVSFKDDLPAGGYKTDINDISLAMNNVTTRGELPAAYTISLNTGRREMCAAAGNISLEPFTISSRVNLSGIVLDDLYPYLEAFVTSPVRGVSDFSGDLAFSRGQGVTLENAMLRIKGLQSLFGKGDGVSVPLLHAEGGALNLKERKATVRTIVLSGGRVDLSRDEYGVISTPLEKKAEPVQTGAMPVKAEDKRFSMFVGKVSWNGIVASFRDHMKDSPRFEVGNINAEVSAVNWPVYTEMPVRFSAEYGKGRLAVAGRFNPVPFHFKGGITSSNLPFADFDIYLPKNTDSAGNLQSGFNLQLLDGKLDAKLSLDLMIKDGKPAGIFNGEGAIRDFYAIDADDEDLLKWESLVIEPFKGEIAPISLSMTGISLNNYYSRIRINKNGRINLQDIYLPAGKQESVNTISVVPGQSDGRKAIRIEKASLSGGVIDFSDYHLNRDFATTMFKMGGRISGLDTVPSSTADIDLRGNLENHSPLRISGRINPLAKELFLDMQIDFKEIDLSPMTPYSGTYLGYVIDKGKLSLTMKYKVENRNLSAENKVFIDQFTFGESVKSNKATSLPVRLAVALLKDKNGEIHLDLPLSGKTDAPEFSVWRLVGQVLKNLLVKAATSPLTLLTSGFDPGTDFSSVMFRPGSSYLTTAAEDKLRLLAKALNEKPGVTLDVAGFADRERDPEGYRVETLIKKMRSEKNLALAKIKREPVSHHEETGEIPADEQPKWLKAVYEKERFPRPRTVIGTLKDLPDEEMKKLILANIQVTDQQLRSLARERALVVSDFLRNEGKVSGDRIFEKSADPFTLSEKDRTSSARVELVVGVK